MPADPGPVQDVGQLFDEHRTRIQRYIRGMVRNQAEAEDLTQETFLRAHRQIGSLRDGGAVTSWLYRIATHVCYDRFRQSSKRDARHVPEAEGERCEPPAPRLEKLLEQTEMSACVQSFIDRLPDAYRSVLLLHDVHGLTSAEIARLRASTLEAVKVCLHRARRKLQAALSEGCKLSHDERNVLVCEKSRRAGTSD